MALLTLFQKEAAQSRCTIEATSIIEDDGSAGANDRVRVRAAVGGRGCINERGHVKFSHALCAHTFKVPPLLNPGYASVQRALDETR